MYELKAVIFDMDGVIFDTESLWKKAFECANKEFALDLTESYRQSTCGKKESLIREELTNAYPKLDVAGYRNFMLDYVNRTIDCGDFEIKIGFLELIEFLKSKNLKIALATSSHKKRAEALFKKKNLDLYSIFDTTVFAEDVGTKSKPDPYIFLSTADRLGEKPENCIVLEDSLNGVEAAINGGFQTVMVVDLIEPTAYCEERCQNIVRSLSEFCSLIKRDERD